MTAAKLNIFSGIRPRLPDSLLPANCATVAQNCDLAYGELRNTKGGYLVNNMTNRPKSIYTDDGLTFYTWPNDVNAVRCPMVSDTYNRLYVTDGTNFKVTNRLGTSPTGGVPATAYSVGVPKPSVAPGLTLPSMPDLSNATLTFKFHYEYAGTKYQEKNITPTVKTANSTWTYVPDAINGSSTSGGTTFKVSSYEIVNTDNATSSWYALGTTVDATVVGPNLFTYPATPSTMTGGLPYLTVNTGRIKDENGLIHELESLWSIAKYGVLNSSTVANSAGVASGKTPTSAIPVVRMTAVDKTTNATLFDIYSSNSSLTGTSTSWKLSQSLTDTASGTYTLTLESGVTEASKETRAYVYTYVNIYGEEGPPSPPATIDTTPILAVNVKVTMDAIGSYAPIKEVRIYRTPTGSTIASYFYSLSITDFSAGGATFTVQDATEAAALAEELASTYYYAPPADLVGIMALPNGILCAWRKNELWFSEAYKPWAWPPAYCKPLSHAIVGGIAQGAGAVITTVAVPYAVYGVSPDAMSASKLNVDQAGVSKWSIASADGAVVYASNDGLVVISGATGSLAKSEVFFTRDTWRKRYGQALSTMVFSVWDGRLVVFSNTGAFTPFMIRLDEADGTMTDLPGLTAACAFISQVSDQFYYASSSAIYQFNGGVDQTAVWKSAERVTERPLNLGFAQAVVEGNWTIQFFASGVLRKTKEVSTGVTNFRLPGGFKSDRWQIGLSGTGRFRELRFATTAVELSSV